MPTIETLLLANHAEAHRGTLYLMGGGWTVTNRRIREGAPPPVNHFGIAATVIVPWTETEQEHTLTLWVEGEDGGPPLMRVETRFRAGRPEALPPGADQRHVLALGIDTRFPHAGGYRLVAQVGESRRDYAFRVVDRVVGSTPGDDD
ncbi:MAG: hypothetical protein AB1Z57_08080 [Acidimicrobiia bacterium]